MRSSTRARVRTGALSVATATALATALVVTPATAANGSTAVASAASHTSGSGSTHASQRPRLVTLLTGDRVLVRHDAAGRTLASLTPRSPHYGRPVQYLNTGTHTWVVPKLAPSVRSRLDNSLFDVAALARSGRVPLKVTFAKGAAPRGLPGLRERGSSARTVAGRTTVTASYDARRPLPAAFASSLRGVSRIALAAAVPQAAPGYELHTLTINGTDSRGRVLQNAGVFVMNMDDARLFGAFGGLIDGQWKVSVPTGHYIVIADNFRSVVLDQVEVGAADATTSFSLASATVKPHSVYPDHKSLGGSLDLIGSAADGGGFDFGFGGFFPRLSPLPSVAAGTLVTEVGNQWSTRHYEPFEFTHNRVITHPIKFVANAKEVRRGIPTKLDFRYRPSDFASVAIRHDDTGAKTDAFDGWAGITPVDQFIFTTFLPSVRPGVIHAQFQGGRDRRWLSSTTASASFRTFTELDSINRYRRGQRAHIEFFRAPITPVADRGDESGRTGFFCSLCVHDGVLDGNLPLMSSAGTTQRGFTSQGRWQLLRGRTSVGSGRGGIFPHVKNVSPGQKMTLVAQTGKQAKGWEVSTHVFDGWTFRVPSGNAVVPILRANYVPPTSTASVGKAGKVSFPITFDNLGPVDARVAKARFRYSVDGSHWHDAKLARQDKNTFRVSYTNPRASRAGQFLDLRVTATDAAGRRFAEQVEHAYFLPHGTGHRAVRQHRTTATPTHRNVLHPKRLCRTKSSQRYGCFVRFAQRTRSVGRASPDPAGWGAPALRDAYDVPDTTSTETVAVVLWFDYPNAEKDMNHYRSQFGLPPCTSASGCFRKINQKGEQGNYPSPDFDASVEMALDLEMISAACPTCHIVLAEANQPTDRSLAKAEAAAVGAGATVTNHSFGRIELTGTDTADVPYSRPGVTAVAATGDFGYGPASFPASSPNVVGVGGTTLARSATDPRGWTERVWRFGGSGCSAYFAKPVWQTDAACHNRTDSDLAAVARGLAIYDTFLPKRFRGWLQVDGTSASSPFVAGLIGNAGRGGLKPGDLYGQPGSFNDVVAGSNGFCQGSYLCTGVAGYDGPTGWGSPKGTTPFG